MKALLCALGVHGWDYENRPTPVGVFAFRKCDRCPARQMFCGDRWVNYSEKA